VPPHHPKFPTLVASGSHPPSAPQRTRRRKIKGEEEKEEPFEGATRRRREDRRPPVESLDAEKPSTLTSLLLCFLYQHRHLPLRRVKPFFTASFTFWSRRP
jgi:hypothetical protein